MGDGTPTVGARIAGIGVAHPPPVGQEELFGGFVARHYQGRARAKAARIFRAAGVRQRHPAVNPAVEDLSGTSTGARMQRYLAEALPLGKSCLLYTSPSPRDS